MKSENTKYLVVVTGPTGIGKSALSYKLQEWLKTQIISADSRQIYREMYIGTAKPHSTEIIDYNIKMVDHVSIHQKYSVGSYERDAIQIIKEGFKNKSIQLLVGGTGLYIEAIKFGIDNFPEVDPSILININKDLNTYGIKKLQQELHDFDPEYYKIVDINNSRRIIRALSVIRSSKQKFSSFLNQTKKERTFSIVELILNEERQFVYKQINQRVDRMVQNGLEEEAKTLFDFRKLPALNTVGYSEWFAHFDNQLSKSEAIEKIKVNTRRYAKRQLTWIRKHNSGLVIKPNQIELAKSYISKACKLK